MHERERLLGFFGATTCQYYRNRSGGNQENELHGIGWNHYEQAVVIDFIANNSE
jgi:hypothetical protein